GDVGNRLSPGSHDGPVASRLPQRPGRAGGRVIASEVLMTADAVQAFPSRFEMRYSLDEAMRYTAARQRRQRALIGPGRTWMRLLCLTFLISGLGLVARALGLLEAEALPAVATLFSVAFAAGVYAAWTEMGFASKRANRALLDHGGIGFGPWQV